jgi:hypothetical protein
MSVLGELELLVVPVPEEPALLQVAVEEQPESGYWQDPWLRELLFHGLLLLFALLEPRGLPFLGLPVLP